VKEVEEIIGREILVRYCFAWLEVKEKDVLELKKFIRGSIFPFHFFF